MREVRIIESREAWSVERRKDCQRGKQRQYQEARGLIFRRFRLEFLWLLPQRKCTVRIAHDF